MYENNKLIDYNNNPFSFEYKLNPISLHIPPAIESILNKSLGCISILCEECTEVYLVDLHMFPFTNGIIYLICALNLVK